MKTITLTELKTLLARNDWKHTQELEIIERFNREEERYCTKKGGQILVDIPHVFGVATKTSTLDNITIKYTEGFNYDEFNEDSLSAGTEGQDEVWSFEGIKVIDDEDGYDVTDTIDWYLTDIFSEIDYSELNIEEVDDVDVNEDSKMETFTLEIDNEPNIRFTGELITETASSSNQAMGGLYSGSTGRWTELSLYKTVSGKYICHQIGRTQWVGEHDLFSGKVCKSIEEVKDFFGHRWLAKELYDNAKIDDVIDVE